MKNVSISLTDRHAAEIDAMIAGGDYASVSEVIRAALRQFMKMTPGPSLAQIERDIAEYRASLARGDKFCTGEEVLAMTEQDTQHERQGDAAE